MQIRCLRNISTSFFPLIPIIVSEIAHVFRTRELIQMSFNADHPVVPLSHNGTCVVITSAELCNRSIRKGKVYAVNSATGPVELILQSNTRNWTSVDHRNSYWYNCFIISLTLPTKNSRHKRWRRRNVSHSWQLAFHTSRCCLFCDETLRNLFFLIYSESE